MRAAVFGVVILVGCAAPNYENPPPMPYQPVYIPPIAPIPPPYQMRTNPTPRPFTCTSSTIPGMTGPQTITTCQ